MDRTTSSETNYPYLSMLMGEGHTCDQRWQAASLEPSLSWRSPACVSSWYTVLMSLSILDPCSGAPLEEVHLDQGGQTTSSPSCRRLASHVWAKQLWIRWLVLFFS